MKKRAGKPDQTKSAERKDSADSTRDTLPAGPAADPAAPLLPFSNGEGVDHPPRIPAEPSSVARNEVPEPDSRLSPDPAPEDLADSPAWDFDPLIVRTEQPAWEEPTDNDLPPPGASATPSEASIPLSEESFVPDLVPIEPVPPAAATPQAPKQPGPGPPSSEDRALAPMAQVAVPVPMSAQDSVVLEQRIRRLEDTLARLLAQPNANPGGAPAGTAPAGSSTTGSSLVSAAAVAGVVSSVGQLLGVGKPASGTTAAVGAAVRRAWWLTELVAKVRAGSRMYVDPRYRMSWVGRIVPPTMLAAFILSKWWIPFAAILDRIPVVGSVIVLIVQVPVELIVAYAFFKALGYEARRYRETAPDLPPSLRL